MEAQLISEVPSLGAESTYDTIASCFVLGSGHGNAWPARRTWPDSTIGVFRNDMTGPVLDTNQVHAARRKEMDFMANLNVWG